MILEAMALASAGSTYSVTFSPLLRLTAYLPHLQHCTSLPYGQALTLTQWILPSPMGPPLNL